MSQKEIKRIAILEKLKNKEVKLKKAAELLGLCTKQTRRLLVRYKREGAKGITHKGRGAIGNRHTDKEIIEQALKIVAEKYPDFTVSLAHEKLKELHEFPYSRETLRGEMIAAGLHHPQTKTKFVVHGIRERRVREGELVQIDGSPHDWFEGRSEYCDLLVFIDDATGKLKELLFVPHETTIGYMKALKHYIKAYGKPLALYSDRHNIFKLNSSRGGSATSMDETGLTQFGRSCHDLSIELLFAYSPQAKGRVERVNQTLQDRLVKEMRLRGINNMEEANKYLPEFMTDFNKRFGVNPRSPINAHKPLEAYENLDEILVEREVRTVSRTLTISYQNQLIQLLPKGSGRTLLHQKVEVRHDTEGTMSIRYGNQNLQYKAIAATPASRLNDSKTINQTVDKLKHAYYPPEYEEPWLLFTPKPAERLRATL